jgi:biopolymer transport protein ExbB/TolQ
MYFKIKCPHCDKSLKVREEQAGRSCACPYCKGTVQISRQNKPEPTEEAALPQIDTSVTPKEERVESKSAVSSKQTPKESMAKAPEGEWTDSSNVSLSESGLIGFGATVLFFLILYPGREHGLAPLFWDRGWVPFVLTLLMFWSWAMLILKWRKIHRQRASMLLDLLPVEMSEEISLETIDKFEQHIHELPGERGESFLINRTLRGLEHFRVRQSVSETAAMLESQSAIDANTVASSYSILKVFIWALPIMGFIGTVIGVSAAVSSLGGSLEEASDISVVKDSLNSVFAGLGTAFDTTLLALVMSLFVKIPASALQKTEEDLVTWVDDYCNENLLRRLKDGGENLAQRESPGDANLFRREIEELMKAHQVELSRLVSQFQGSLSELGQQALASQNEMVKSVHVSSTAFQAHYTGLEKGLSSLSGVLEQLGEYQVLVQQVEKPKRRWFGRSNGSD